MIDLFSIKVGRYFNKTSPGELFFIFLLSSEYYYEVNELLLLLLPLNPKYRWISSLNMNEHESYLRSVKPAYKVVIINMPYRGRSVSRVAQAVSLVRQKRKKPSERSEPRQSDPSGRSRR